MTSISRSTVRPVAPSFTTSVAAEPKPAAPARADSFVAGIATQPVTPGGKDTRFDGQFLGGDGRAHPPGTPLASIPGLTPNDGTPVQGRAVYVNGIMTDAIKQQSEMQALANTGLEVVGLHNATEGFAKDLGQCVTDKLGKGENPAIASTRALILDAVAKGEPLMLVGHSQGALVISRGLVEAKDTLLATRRPGQSKADRLAEVEAQLSSITVETYGGAAARYPDGPRYTHYVNKADSVPMGAGVGSAPWNPFDKPGRGAVIRELSVIEKPGKPDWREGLSKVFATFIDQTTHGAREIYFERRQP